MIDPIKWDKNT